MMADAKHQLQNEVYNVHCLTGTTSSIPKLTNGDSELSKELTNGTNLQDDRPFAGSMFDIIAPGMVRKLYASSVEAKIWGVALKGLHQTSPPCFYPEYTKPGGTKYVYRKFDFWTSGFFPGSLYLLLERRKKYPNLYSSSAPRPHNIQLEHACSWWKENLHQNAVLQATHDLGFMIMPWARVAWELNRDTRSLETMKTAAKTLAARYSPTVGCMRSWDTCQTRKYHFQDPGADFLVIIDNMMNLSLLFFIAQQTGDSKMKEVAVQHARTTARIHVRPNGSTTHLVVFDPANGDVKDRLTNQGFSHTSCWTRGQAWAIAGFAETFYWTQDETFLGTACRCADYFLDHLPLSGIAPWDFDALAQSSESEIQPPDTSANMIAAYGLLLIHKGVVSRGEQSRYLAAALRLVEAVCGAHLSPPASYVTQTEETDTVEHGMLRGSSGLSVDMGSVETIINGATINNYEFAPRRWADHGLVYADYFFLLFGNELLKTDLGTLLGD